MSIQDQIADRQAKLEKIRGLGFDPYGQRFTDVTPNADVRTAAEAFNIETGQILETSDAEYTVAGRIVLYRDIGSLIFMTLRDQSGDLQVGLSKKMLKGVGERTQGHGDAGARDEGASPHPHIPTSPPDPAAQWKLAKLFDLGDIVGITGVLGKTKTGELTVWGRSVTMLSKALRPPPGKWHGLSDLEARYRRRYVDLAANPDSRAVFLKRAQIIDYGREVLRRRGFIEVETPVLQPIYGGAAARPFLTHHNTLDMQLYLRISPELYLKRCLVGGLERVYEFSRCFRNEGISPRHNPEFTMLELYQAYADYHDMMDICEDFIGGAARDVIGSTKIEFGEVAIDYTTPWPRRKYADLFEEHVGISLFNHDAIREKARPLEMSRVQEVLRIRREMGVSTDEAHRQGLQDAAVESHDPIILANELFEEYVEPSLINPTFVIDYPAPLCPLTKRVPGNPNFALRFELFINGMEIGNAYSELNDPAIQRENFGRQLHGEGDETMAVMDEDFVESLEHGMPPAGGLGLGIDRIVMLLTGSQSIRDVLLFPLQRPESGGRDARAEEEGTEAPRREGTP